MHNNAELFAGSGADSHRCFSSLCSEASQSGSHTSFQQAGRQEGSDSLPKSELRTLLVKCDGLYAISREVGEIKDGSFAEALIR